ncbi:MAG: hypothetical protein ACLFVB_01335 [Thermoplasmata archaeon]
MKIYFSHPTFTFRTKTEKECIEIIYKYLDADEIINPADFGLKHDVRKNIRKADAIVGMAVSEKFTFLVWNEMDVADKVGEKLYTMMVESQRDIGPLVEGVPENIERLSKNESKAFSHKMMKGNYMSMFPSLSIFKGSKRF